MDALNSFQEAFNQIPAPEQQTILQQLDLWYNEIKREWTTKFGSSGKYDACSCEDALAKLQDVLEFWESKKPETNTTSIDVLDLLKIKSCLIQADRIIKQIEEMSQYMAEMERDQQQNPENEAQPE